MQIIFRNSLIVIHLYISVILYVHITLGFLQSKWLSWGTAVRELTRGLATLTHWWIQEPLVVRDREERPLRGPSGSALLLCVSGSALLGDLHGTWSSVCPVNLS